MKNRFVLILWSALWLGACGSGTDVGNPGDGQLPAAQSPAPVSTETVSDFLGTYAVPELSEPMLDSGGEAPVANVVQVATCPVGTPPFTISAGATADRIVLEGFFAFPGFSNSLGGRVRNGEIELAGSSASLMVSCVGTLVDTILQFECTTLQSGVTEQCVAMFEQQSVK
ncbi:MAG: hypothetical protein HY696_10390 [Deltaproteobacteria bacterium]|nr:hypothetical protein [Deltaproteobacteria bacterium]